MPPQVLVHATLIALMLVAVVPSPARPRAGLTGPALSDDDLLVLEVRLERHLLATDLLAYLGTTGVLIPLVELVELLDLAIRVEPGRGRAKGWFVSESRRFDLDLSRRQVVVDGRVERVDPALVVVHEGQLLVDTKLLSSWLPIDLEVDLAALELRIMTREQLPLQLKLARRQRWSGLTPRATERGPRFTLQHHPYQLIDWPMVDGSSSVALVRERDGRMQRSARYSVLAQGDLLAMTAELYLAGTADRDQVEALSDARLSLGRRDPEHRLLGFMRAGEYRLGDLTTPYDSLISNGRPALGLELGRQPQHSTSDFDRITLRGDAQPGWDLELYRNQALLEVLTVADDGRYELREIPLQVGLNILRLVFYGPHGEVREQVERIFIGSHQVAPGATTYHLGLYQRERGLLQASSPSGSADDAVDVQSGLQLHAELEHGVSRSLSLTAEYWDLPHPEGRRRYAGAGVKLGLLGGAGQLRLVHQLDGGWAAHFAYQRRLGRFSLSAEHLVLERFHSEVQALATLDRHSQLRLHGQLRLPGLGSVPVSLSARHEVRATGAQIQVHAGASFSRPVARLVLTNRLDLSLGDRIAVHGDLLINGRLRRMLVRGTISYSLLPEPELSALDLTGTLDLGRRLALTSDLGHSLETGITSLSGGIDWSCGRVILGLDAGVSSNGNLQTGASLAFNLGREPRRGRWQMRAGTGASKAAVSARVFLDLDGDGSFSEGDQPLPGVGFVFDGARQPVTTDGHGIAFLQLPSHSSVDLAVDQSTLEDPFWSPQVRGMSLVTRPGMIRTADFPVVLTGEIDGMVLLSRDGRKRELANVHLQLIDATGTIAGETRSQFDGFYLFDRVLPGRYLLRLDPEQAARRHLRAAEPTVVLTSGAVLSSVDIIVNIIVEQAAH